MGKKVKGRIVHDIQAHTLADWMERSPLDGAMDAYLDVQERQSAKKEKTALQMLGKREDFLWRITEVLSQQRWQPKPYRPANHRPFVKERVLNIMLSDLHYGANLDAREVPIQYGPTEERRRTAAIVREVCGYKEHYRQNTSLYVHLAGDLIQGRLHDLRTGAPMAEQFARALWVLSGALARFVEAFPRVTVFCTPGNHGRIKDRHPERATDEKWDSYENMLYEALRVRFSGVKSIKFHIPRTPFYQYEAFGMRGFITHGDTVINPGYPGRTINVQNVEKQVLKLSSAKGYFDLIGVGHVHVASTTQLPNGTVLLTNGCLIPPDAYAVSIGIHSTACCQQLWETVPGYMFGDHRILNVTTKHDQDKTLDDVIPEDV
jgi:hypothetical protein